MAVIKTKKFILRSPRLSDAASIVKHLNDYQVSRNLSSVPFPYGLKDAKKWLRKKVKSKGDKTLSLLIEIEREAVGGISLDGIKKGHEAELGYWLGRQHWGKGIMTGAVKAITKHGFKKYKLRRIQAHAYHFNKASMRVLEKNGFKLEGFLRKAFKKDGKILDGYIFSKVK